MAVAVDGGIAVAGLGGVEVHGAAAVLVVFLGVAVLLVEVEHLEAGDMLILKFV